MYFILQIIRCWIKVDPDPKSDPAGEVWRWLCFYLPLLGSIGYVGTVYYKIWGQLTAPNVSRKNSDVDTTNNPTPNTGGADAPSAENDTNEVEPAPKESTSDVYNHGRQNSSNLDVLASSTDIQNSAEDVTKKKSGGMMQRIKFYPFVLFGCYFFAIIRRIAEWGDEDRTAPFGIAAIQVFTSALLGTCNAILYGFTPMVFQKDSEWIKSKCCGGSAKYVL